MDTAFLGVPDTTPLIFSGFALAAFCTAFIGVVTGTAGGLLLLALMALVLPPAVLIPVHTAVQLGAGSSRTLIMWRLILRATVLPFLIGALIGAAAGAQIFMTLSTAALQGLIGGFIIVFAWLPRIARAGPERGRFAVVGFLTTFLGMFVSATGTILSPFAAAASPDRRVVVATFGALITIVHVTKLVTFLLLGVAVGAYIPLIVVMIAGAATGNWVGIRALNRIPERGFRILFKVLLTALALRLLWSAARDSGIF